MCDPHSKLVQCSISPLYVSVWKDISVLLQASSAHLGSIYPPVCSHDTALWHHLICHCCRGNLYLESTSLSSTNIEAKTFSTATHTVNTRAALPLHRLEHISSPFLLFLRWCCLNRECDASHPIPPAMSVPAWLALKWSSCAHTVPAQLSLVHVPSPPTQCNLRCGPWQGQT